MKPLGVLADYILDATSLGKSLLLAATIAAARALLGIQISYLASTQSVTSNAGLTAVTLTPGITITSGKKYAFWGYFPFTCATGGGARGRITGGGLTGTFLFHQVAFDDAGVRLAGGKFTALASSTATGTGSVTGGHFLVRGYVDATANAALTFAYGQDTSNGSATSLLAGGWLIAWEV